MRSTRPVTESLRKKAFHGTGLKAKEVVQDLIQTPIFTKYVDLDDDEDQVEDKLSSEDLLPTEVVPAVARPEIKCQLKKE